MNEGNMRGKKGNDDGLDNGIKRSKSVSGTSEMSKSWSAKDMKLPKINFNRKAARSVSRVNKGNLLRDTTTIYASFVVVVDVKFVIIISC